MTSEYQPSLAPKGFPKLPAGWHSLTQLVQSSTPDTKNFVVIHKASSQPSQRVLFVFHGLGEHSGRYFHFPHYLASTVDTIVAVDHRGHGQSDGAKGHTDSFEQYADDAAAVIRTITSDLRKENPNVELHLFAHSMGGLIGLVMLRKHKDLGLKSATISAPLLGVKVKVPAWKKAPAYALASLIPKFTLPSGIDANLISHDPNVVEAYEKDPLNHDKVSAKWFVDLQSTTASVLANKSAFDLPVLFVIPLADHIVDHEIALSWAKSLPQETVSILELPDFYHESFNETGKDKPFAALSEWIRRHGQK